jgi:TonB family protein
MSGRYCVLYGLLLSLPAQAAPAVQPSDEWTVDYATSYCILSREGSGQQPGIAFRTRPFADEHDLLVYFGRTGEGYVSAMGKIVLGSDTGVDHGMALMEPDGARYRYLDTQITADELTRAGTANSMRITIKGKLDVTILLPQMAKALTALRACETDLAHRWQAEIGWVRPPKPVRPFYGLITSRDYPSVAFSRNQTGRVRTLLKVDKTGGVVDCKVIESSGTPLLDDRTCSIFRQRIKFQPALDESGKPVMSNYVPPVVDYRLVRSEW